MSSVNASGSGSGSGSDPTVARSVAKDASDFIRELEVERVLKSFKLNPYDILDLPVGATENEVKRQYRQKSLLIHPDKFKHPRGIEAFDYLKKAESMLMDQEKRYDIDGVMSFTRTMILKEILPADMKPSEVTDDHPLVKALHPPLDGMIRSRSKEVFVEEELAKRRKQKLAYANEGAEAAKKEAEVSEKKRKKEEAEAWESRRDERVQGWRSFATKPAPPAKKKKKNLNVLG